MNRLLLLPLLLFTTACTGPSIVKVKDYRMEGEVPSTVYSFDNGTSLTLVADEGVAGYSLEPAQGGLVLIWHQPPGGERWSRTLTFEGGLMRLDGDEVAAGSAIVRLLQGNGEVQLVETHEDLRAKYGTNALAYLGVNMEANKIVATLPDSPARAAGLQKGDVLTGAVAGGALVPLKNRLELADLLPSLRPGETITLVVTREGKELKLDAKLAERSPEVWNKTDG